QGFAEVESDELEAAVDCGRGAGKRCAGFVDRLEMAGVEGERGTDRGGAKGKGVEAVAEGVEIVAGVGGDLDGKWSVVAGGSEIGFGVDDQVGRAGRSEGWFARARVVDQQDEVGG